jgi:hypothetical protein
LFDVLVYVLFKFVCLHFDYIIRQLYVSGAMSLDSIIDVTNIEIESSSTDRMILTVMMVSQTCGGVSSGGMLTMGSTKITNIEFTLPTVLLVEGCLRFFYHLHFFFFLLLFIYQMKRASSMGLVGVQ